MYPIERFVFDGALVTAALWIVKKYLDTLFEKKKLNLLSFSLWCTFALFQIYVQGNNGTGSPWNIIINIFLIFLLEWFGYKRNWKKDLFAVFLFSVIWTLVEMIVFYGLGSLSIEKESSDVIGGVISKIIMAVGVYLFSLLWKKMDDRFVSFPYFLGLIFIPAGSIYIALNVYYFKDGSHHRFSSVIMSGILLLINIFILEMYSKISKSFLYEKDKALYLQHMKLISHHTEEQKLIMENFNREKHDLVNKLIVLKSVLEKGDPEVAVKSMDEIIGSCSAVENISNSGNSALDAVINVKYAIARGKGVKFFLKIFVPEELPIDQYDIGIVLGNLLDNAIAAVEKCTLHEKRIDISIGIKKEALVLVVKNPYEHILKKDKSGNLMSTKEGPHRHGYGISSIRKTVDKYEGDVILEDEGNLFAATVIMNLGISDR